MLWSSLVAPLLAQGAPPVTTAGPWYSEPWFLLLVAVATLVIPYVLGNVIAKSLRMQDYGWKIGLILIALTAGVVIDTTRWPPKLGIDLSGGIKLVYEIDQEKLQQVNIDEIVRRMADDANKAGPFAKQNPAKVVPLKSGTVEVRLPTTDPDRVQKVETALSKLDLSNLSASLNFVISRQENQQTVLEYQAGRSKTAPGVDMDKLIAAVNRRINPGGQHEVAIRPLGADQIEIDIPDVDQTEKEVIKRMIATAGALEFHIVADQQAPQDRDVIDAAKQQLQLKNPSNDVSNGSRIVGRWVDVDPSVRISPNWLTRAAKSGLQVLMVTDSYGVTGSYLSGAQTGYGIGGPQVNFQFDTAGANRFGQLTEQNLPDKNGLVRELGIVLDGTLKSAASIRSKITYAGEITGIESAAEVDFIVSVLNAGQLPAALKKEPVSDELISAELGRDTIHASAMAMFVSSLAVLVFMLFYYRFAGIVADAAVIFNLVLVLALMILLKAAFTLAGLAGLVLSIGMAVDSNVLIYERMREEKERGAALRMVIRNGFGRAMATIIDMHSTTIITGLVLYFIGTEQVRGFAVTLVLGLLVNLFTAVFCARVVFDVAERQRWLTKLKMLRLFGDTKIDFVAIMVPAIIVSILISVLGVACFWHRSIVGPGMFDTDFTGGTVVQIVLKPDRPMSDAAVRKLVEGETQYLPDSTVVAVEGKENRQFIIRTSNQEPTEVQNEIVKLFDGNLKTYGVAPLADLHVITASGAGESKAAEPKATEPKPTQSNATQPKSPEPPTPTSKSGETKANSKTNESKSNTDKSSALPRGGARSSSIVNHSLLALFATDALLLADPAPATPAVDANSTKTKAAQQTAADTKAADTKAADSKSPEVKAAAANSPDKKTAVAPAANAKTPDNKTAETKATNAKATDTKATDTKTTDSKTTDTKAPAPKSSETTSNGAAPSSPPSKEGSGESTGLSGFGLPGAATGAEAFVGGAEVTLKLDQEIPHDSLASLVKDAVGSDVRFELTNSDYTPGDRRAYATWTLRVALPPDQARPLLEKFREGLSKTPVFLGISKIGGRVASDTQTTALYALLASILMIVVYIWIRFQNVIYGIGAVVALVHDVFITVAALAISSYVAPYLGFALVEPFKISLNVVAAILTICGYSISDTIVIFDRIREVRGKSPDLTREIINQSVNQTLSRTVLTVFTVLLVTTILYTSGGQAIHAFAFTMLVGLISGTYSSVYIAAPCLLWMRRRDVRGTTRIQ